MIVMEIKLMSSMVRVSRPLLMVAYLMVIGMKVRCKGRATLCMLMETCMLGSSTRTRPMDMENTLSKLVRFMKGTGSKTSLMVKVSKY